MTLRTRLFLSYAAVIVTTLAVLAIALLVLLAQLQALRNPADMLPDVLRISRALRGGPNSDPRSGFDRLARIVQAPRRMLLVDSSGVILEDSLDDPQAEFARAQLDLRSRLASPQSIESAPAAAAALREQLIAGEFRDVRNRRWEYIGFPVRPGSQATEYLAVARLVASGPLFDVLEETVVVRLVVAGLTALLTAAIIAAIVARSVLRPIQRVARAATAIAGGKYDERVDVSGPREFKQLANDFNSMAVAVQSAQSRERDFLANVTHELKTPLTSIQGYAQAIMDGTVSDTGSTQHAATIIYNESDHLRRMVGGLLDASRLEAGYARLARDAVNVNDVLRACVTRFELAAKDGGIRFSLNLAEIPAVVGDGDRLAQVFTNLIDNAVKFTPAGGTISVETRRAPSHDGTAGKPARAQGVEIDVTDTGAGIAPEDLPHVFDRFYQSKVARETLTGSAAASGVGLGLAICKQIVEAHEGTIEAHSALGAGTRLRVWLPAQV